MLSLISPKIYRFDSLHSTNDSLKEMKIGSVVQEGAVVVTSEQTKGRGVTGSWESNPNENLTFSIYLEPMYLKVSESHFINYLVTYSLYQYVSLYTEDAMIKWPNDILILNKKVAGVLIENTFETKNVKSSIIGIGLNINQLHFSQFGRQATSLKSQTNKHFDLKKELDCFLEILLKNYASFQFSKDRFLAWYHERLYLKGVQSRFLIDETEVLATIKGVDAYGRLIMDMDESKEVKCFDLKEVKFLD